MKKRILVALRALMMPVMMVIVAMLMAMPQQVQESGNDFLEKDYRYMAYSTGMDRIHFKIPM